MSSVAPNVDSKSVEWREQGLILLHTATASSILVFPDFLLARSRLLVSRPFMDSLERTPTY